MPNTDELIEKYRNIRLVLVGKLCPQCGVSQRMDYLHSEVKCECGTLVKFTHPEMLYLIKTESQFSATPYIE